MITTRERDDRTFIDGPGFVLTIHHAHVSSGLSSITTRLSGSSFDRERAKALSEALRRADGIAGKYDREPIGMEDPLPYDYVTFTEPVKTDGIERQPEDTVLGRKNIPAGAYGHVPNYAPRKYDWDRGVTLHLVSTIYPGAFASAAWVTANQVQEYKGNPYKDDPEAVKPRPRSRA